jgi:hypothetical protein
VALGVLIPLAVDESLPGLAGGIIATVLGLTAASSGAKDLTKWWRVLTTDAIPIDESVATDGVVQIKGTVRPLRSSTPVLSPIRGKECVAYEYNISHQVQGTGDPSIDAGTECHPFIVSDGTAAVYVEPSAESLSLETEITTVTGGEEMLEQVDEERLDLEPSAHTGNAGWTKDYIELVEGIISVDETITVVGNTEPAPEKEAADAVMTSDDSLTVATDEPRAAALRTGARGFFLLIVGFAIGLLGVSAFVTTLDNLLLTVPA